MQITEIYDSFLQALSDKSESIAPLQLTGRLEDYLVHEFIAHVYKETQGELLGLSNLGNRGEQKYDVAFVKNNSMGEREIVSAFEAKYIRNAHRLREKEDATDEITTTLRSLSNQLKDIIQAAHGDCLVARETVGTNVYGLVFASCRKSSPGDGSKRDFFDKKILGKAKEMGFTSYGSNGGDPIFNRVYEDVEVPAVGRKYYLTLRVGLWQSSVSENRMP